MAGRDAEVNLRSGVTVEVVTIGCKGRGVALEICREIMALLHGVHLVVAIASSIGTLADEHLFGRWISIYTLQRPDLDR